MIHQQSFGNRRHSPEFPVCVSHIGKKRECELLTVSRLLRCGMAVATLAAVMATRAEVEAAVAGDKRFAIASASFPENSRTMWAVGMAVKRSSEDLANARTKALAALRDSGELGRIFAKHGVGYLATDVLSAR